MPTIGVLNLSKLVTPEMRSEHSIKAARELFKANRKTLVDDIKVMTSSGHLFDGDETSQTRMARSIAVMNDTETIKWILADNTEYMVTKAELIEALRLAGQAQLAVWVQPNV